MISNCDSLNYFCIAMSRIIICIAYIVRIREPTREDETEEEARKRRDEEMNEKREEKKKRKKEKELPIRTKRETKPRNRAIKALLLASDRAARERLIVSDSRLPFGLGRSPPINREDTREWSDGCTGYCRAFINGCRALWMAMCFGEICGLFEKKFLSLLCMYVCVCVR